MTTTHTTTNTQRKKEWKLHQRGWREKVKVDRQQRQSIIIMVKGIYSGDSRQIAKKTRH